MPRKGPAPKRQVLPDPRFNSRTIARFVNKLMLRGKNINGVLHRIGGDHRAIVALGKDLRKIALELKVDA